MWRSLSPEQSSALFRDVAELEEKMGVRHWQFSTTEQTIQNSSELARSPYFQQWRRAVQAVFDAADQHAVRGKGACHNKPVNRLVLLDIPQALPLEAATAWRRWQGIGKPLKLDFSTAGQPQSPFDFLLTGTPNDAGTPTGGILACRPKSSPQPLPRIRGWSMREAAWSILLSATRRLILPPRRAILLSYARLDTYRQNFSHEMNTMRKDLADADAVFDRLRQSMLRHGALPRLRASRRFASSCARCTSRETAPSSSATRSWSGRPRKHSAALVLPFWPRDSEYAPSPSRLPAWPYLKILTR